MNRVEIVVLANSVKFHQHCVAGKRVSGGGWIRPVSDDGGGELNHNQVMCQNPYGTFGVKTLQKVVINLWKHAPLPHQPENYVVADGIWQQNYNIPEGDLSDYLDTPRDLWGTTDRVAHGEIVSGRYAVAQSLYLVRVSNLRLYLNQYNKRRAQFTYNNTRYDLAVTDPNFDHITKDNGQVMGLLCISLAGEYQGHCFKIVASIF